MSRARHQLERGHLVPAVIELQSAEEQSGIEAPAELWRAISRQAQEGLDDVPPEKTAEHLLWEGIVAYVQQARTDEPTGRPPLERLLEERLKTRPYVFLRLAVSGACPELQSEMRHYFGYRMLAVDRKRADPRVLLGAAARKAAQTGSAGADDDNDPYVSARKADEVVRFLSCEMGRKSGEFVVRWERSVQLPEFDFCEMRPSTADQETPQYFRDCMPDLVVTTGMHSRPRSTKTIERRFDAEGDEEWGRLLFMDSFGRGQSFRGNPFFLESRDLYPHGLELPKSTDELEAFVEAHPEARALLREAALRRALELEDDESRDPLLNIFAPEFQKEFGLGPSQLSAVMRWQW